MFDLGYLDLCLLYYPCLIVYSDENIGGQQGQLITRGKRVNHRVSIEKKQEENISFFLTELN